MLSGYVFCVMSTEAVTAVKKPFSYSIPGFYVFSVLRKIPLQPGTPVSPVFSTFQDLVSVSVMRLIKVTVIWDVTVLFGRICCLRLQGTRSIHMPWQWRKQVSRKRLMPVYQTTRGYIPLTFFLSIHSHDYLYLNDISAVSLLIQIILCCLSLEVIIQVTSSWMHLFLPPLNSRTSSVSVVSWMWGKLCCIKLNN